MQQFNQVLAYRQGGEFMVVRTQSSGFLLVDLSLALGLLAFAFAAICVAVPSNIPQSGFSSSTRLEVGVSEALSNSSETILNAAPCGLNGISINQEIAETSAPYQFVRENLTSFFGNRPYQLESLTLNVPNAPGNGPSIQPFRARGVLHLQISTNAGGTFRRVSKNSPMMVAVSNGIVTNCGVAVGSPNMAWEASGLPIANSPQASRLSARQLSFAMVNLLCENLMLRVANGQGTPVASTSGSCLGNFAQILTPTEIPGLGTPGGGDPVLLPAPLPPSRPTIPAKRPGGSLEDQLDPVELGSSVDSRAQLVDTAAGH